MPSVNKLYTDLKAKGLEVLLISFRENAALVKRTAAERGYVAPVLLDESGDVTGKLYGVWGPPTVRCPVRRKSSVPRKSPTATTSVELAARP